MPVCEDTRWQQNVSSLHLRCTLRPAACSGRELYPSEEATVDRVLGRGVRWQSVNWQPAHRSYFKGDTVSDEMPRGLRRFVNILSCPCLGSELLETRRSQTGGDRAVSFPTEKLIRKECCAKRDFPLDWSHLPWSRSLRRMHALPVRRQQRTDCRALRPPPRRHQSFPLGKEERRPGGMSD